MSSSPIYTNRVSVAQMEEQKRKATAEGMRQLAEAMLSSNNQRRENPNDEISDDTNSDSDSSNRRNKRSRGGTKVINVNNGVVEKLENRIRFLQLDLTNAHVDIEDTKAKVEKLTEVIAPYKRVNDELAYIKSSLTRALQNTSNLTKMQLEIKFKQFYEEANEHAALCNVSIAKIELDEVKSSLLRILAAERKRIVHTEKNFKILIFKSHVKELTFKILTSVSVIIIILAVLYQLFIWLFL